MSRIRSDKENLELINSLPTIRIAQLNYPYGIGQHDPLTYRPLSWLSKIIRRVRNSPVNHMGVVHWDEDKGTVFTEANEKGVNTNPLSKRLEKWRDRNVTLVAFVPKDFVNKDNNIVNKISKEEYGKSYGFFSLLQFLWATIFRHPVRSKALRTGKVHVCSTLMMKLLTNITDYWRYSPKEVWDSKYFEKKRIVL